MSSQAPRNFDRFRRSIVALISSASATVSFAILLGWSVQVPVLRSGLPGFPQMKPDSAVGFILAAAALLIAFYFDGRRRTVVLSAIGLVISTGASLALGAYYFGSSIGTEALLLPYPMSPYSAFGFLFVGLSIILVSYGRSAQVIAEKITLVVLSAAFAILVAYLYGADLPTGTADANMTSMPAAALFALTSVGLLILNPACELTNLLFSDSIGGRSARLLIPLVVVVPTVIGFLRVIGQEYGLYNTGLGTTMSTFVIVLLMFGIVFFYSQTVHRADQERINVEKDLARNERLYHDLFDYSQSILSTHDLEGKLLSVNRAMVESLGYQPDEVVGMEYEGYIDERYRNDYAAYLRKIVNEGEDKGLVSMVAKDGRKVVWQYHNILISEPDREPYVLGSALDVTHLLKVQRELEKASLTDELTGILNRRGFLAFAEQMLKLERHSSTARGLTLLFADMDGLKTINDTCGHEAGSESIQTIARVMRSVVRSGDIVARWGGDEFVILTVGTDADTADQMIKRIYERLEEHNAFSGKPYKVACSIGLANLRSDGSRSFEDMIAEADKAMYTEKKRRKASQIREGRTSEGENDLPDSLAWY